MSLWHVGDVIRKLRDRHGLSPAGLARRAGVSRRLVSDLERRGPGLEEITPLEWRALDRLAVALGLGNGASLYRLVPPSAVPGRTPPTDDGPPRRRVIPFQARSRREKP